MLDSGTDCRPGRVVGVDEVRLCHRGFRLLPDPSAAKKIKAVIVRDPKQPRSKRAAVVVSVEAPVGAKQGVLNHVFAICEGAGHAGTVSVQTGPEVADRFEKGQV